MTGGVALFNFAGGVAGLTIAAMSVLVAVFSRFLEKNVRWFLIAFFLILSAYAGCDLIAQISAGCLGPDFTVLSKVTLFLASFFSSVLMPMLSVYLIFCAGEEWKRHPLLFISLFLWILYAGLLAAAQFTSVFYFFTPDNVYHRGPYYALLLIPPALLMLLNFFAVLRRRKKLTALQFRGFLCYMLIPLLSVLVQMFFYGIHVIVIGTAASALVLFSHILVHQTGFYVAQQQENNSQRLNIAILQMRPHFIYNTMTSIYYLVRQDSVRAQQVIADFTNYLRKNFTAIAANEPIQFAEELEHTRAYLAVEQVRFEGKLFVRYDTPVTGFRLPPLTLQPIVENAVKHNVDPDLAPVTITIRTVETEEEIRLIVSDTGTGFDEADSNGVKGALENIRERLKLMCNGSLSIAPGEHSGTTVTVCLPKNGVPQSRKRRK